MRELNISTFIQVMQLGLKEHDTQFAAGTFLLEALNQPDLILTVRILAIK